MVRLREKVFFFTKMEVTTLEIGLKISSMDLELKNG